MRKFHIVFFVVLTVLFINAAVIDPGPVDRASLGKLLFFDTILSSDRSVSCASCHRPQYAFADTNAVSTGVSGAKGSRNSPSAMNMILRQSFFWDGRASTLEEQALAPISNPSEMNLPLDSAIRRLRQSKQYRDYFKKIFSEEPCPENLASAIAAFERTLETNESPFDNWRFLEDSKAVTESAKRGYLLFNAKGKCNKCHFGADFTQNEFRNIGLFNGKNLNDSGRMVISGKKEDLGRFKTPSLRNVSITAPYMHNGIFGTLEEVIDFYNDPNKIIPNAINRDSVLAQPLGLTRAEKTDIKSFLLTLTDKRFMQRKKFANER